MSTGPSQAPAPDHTLISDLLDVLDKLSGFHPGFRPAHAKGVMVAGTFTPAAGAKELTRAPHATRPSTPVIVRFSASAGVPTVADNDPKGASPRGIAIRFSLADHVHTDIVAHSHNGFAVHTGEEFLAFLSAVAASGPDSTHPTPLDTFLATHPKAVQFVTAPKPIPTSYAREAFYAITAFQFTNQAGVSRYGRFRIRPEAGTDYLSDADAAKQTHDFLTDELTARLANGPAVFRIFVQLAEDSDVVTDSSAVWPEDRPDVEFGTLTLTHRVDETAPEFWKIIFDPDPRVDGIAPAGDPLTQVRAALYLLSGRRRRTAPIHSGSAAGT
jgi:catalase